MNNQWPWISFRRDGTTSKLELTSRWWSSWAVTKKYTGSDVHSVKITRENGKVYIAINGWNKEEVSDYSNFTGFFDKPITIGSIYQSWAYSRYIKATLSNIMIKTIDTTSCHTWNVYVVTWDCQMTANFKAVEEYPDVTVNHHWMNIGWSGYTIHETEHFSWNIWDEFTAIEKEYTWFTANLNNDDTIIISGDNNVIDLYYDRHWWYFYFLIDPFNSANITVSGCDNGTCWYGEDVQLTLVEETWYTFNSWGIPQWITLPQWLDRTSKTLSFTMPDINDMQIRWGVSLSAIPYTITYHLDGWNEVEHNQTGYTAGNFVIYVTDPIKTGYDFLWWTWGVINWPQLSWPTTWLVIVVNDMWNVEVWDREYYANWTPKMYAVTGSVATWQENMWYLSGLWNTWINLTWLYEYGSELIFITIPELGYLFDYWEVNNGTGDNLPDGAVASGNQLTVIVDQILDIVAHFKENVGTVTVNYYEMNTWWTYSWVTNSTTFTWLVWYTRYATLNPPYGFHLDTERTINTWIVILDNDAENVINIYYARDKNHVIISYTWDFVWETTSFGSTVIVNPVLKERYYYGEHVHFSRNRRQNKSIAEVIFHGKKFFNSDFS